MNNLKTILIYSLLLFFFFGCAINEKNIKKGPQNILNIKKVSQFNDEIYFLEPTKNYLAIVTKNGFYIRKNEKLKDISFSISALTPQVKTIKNINGKVCICSLNGFFIIGENGEKIDSYYSSTQTLTSDFITDVVGNNDFLLIGTDQGVTLHLFDQALYIRFEKYKEMRTISGWYTLNSDNSPILDNNILKVRFYDDKMFIVSKNGLTIYYWQLDYFETFSIKEYFGNSIITDVVKYQNTFYFSTYNGIISYDELTKMWKIYDNGGIFEDKRIDKILIAENKIYFSTPSAIYSFDILSETYDKIILASDIFGSNFTSLCYFRGSLFIGTSNGLLRYNKMEFELEQIIKDKTITDLKVYDNTLIAATSNEIFKIF